jgi:hypothetical protein
MRPFQRPVDRRVSWHPQVPQDAEGTPPKSDLSGTLIVPNLDGVSFQAAAAGTRIIPSPTLGL